jgi:hypothetical protein
MMNDRSSNEPSGMASEPETCAVEGKKLGKICVGKSGFTFSLTDETREKMKERIKVMKQMAPESEKHVLDTSLMLLDKGAYVTKIPASEVLAVGKFPFNDSKTESIFGISISPGFSNQIKMTRPVALLRLSNEDAASMLKSTPVNAKRVDDIGNLVNFSPDKTKPRRVPAR